MGLPFHSEFVGILNKPQLNQLSILQLKAWLYTQSGQHTQRTYKFSPNAACNTTTQHQQPINQWNF
jgi:hypothetical protein